MNPNTNYKTVSVVLGLLLLVSLGFNFAKIKPAGDMHHDDMHMMPNGDMMQNNNHQMGGNMNSMMMDMTKRMQGKTGSELDKVFLEDMIVHHQGAVDMAKILATGTQRPELQKMASDIITVQNKEIEMMQGWLKQWYQK